MTELLLPFDPCEILPTNVHLTETTREALVQFYRDNQREPTPEEVAAITGTANTFENGKTDPLPDGYAGEDWGNPNWIRRLVARQRT